MPRLISPTGITVNVDDATAENLRSVGYSSADDTGTRKPAAKKAASSKTEK